MQSYICTCIATPHTCRLSLQLTLTLVLLRSTSCPQILFYIWTFLLPVYQSAFRNLSSSLPGAFVSLLDSQISSLLPVNVDKVHIIRIYNRKIMDLTCLIKIQNIKFPSLPLSLSAGRWG